MSEDARGAGVLDKKSLSERDICTKFITPAIVAAGWDIHTQVRKEVSFTVGRVIVRGRQVSRGEAKRADYILVVTQDYHSYASGKAPRYYQLVAINRTIDTLADQVGRDYDPFDLVCHVAFGRPPLTRCERADQVRKRDYFTRFGEQARAVLDALLEKYADEGIENIEALDVLRVQPFDRFGTPLEIIQRFGGKAQYLRALRELESQLYLAA